jgi:hypothetical protein
MVIPAIGEFVNWWIGEFGGLVNWASQALPRVRLERGSSRAMQTHQFTKSPTH